MNKNRAIYEKENELTDCLLILFGSRKLYYFKYMLEEGRKEEVTSNVLDF